MSTSVAYSPALQAPIALAPPPAAVSVLGQGQGGINNSTAQPTQGVLSAVGAAVRMAISPVRPPSGVLTPGGLAPGLLITRNQAPNPVGANLAAGGSSAFYYEDFPITQNLVMMGKQFETVSSPGVINSGVAAPLSNGWPTSDFGQFLHVSSRNPSWLTAGGAFACGFVSRGSGTEVITGAAATVSNVVRNGTLVTFDLTPTGTTWGYTITGSSGGVASVWAYIPKYRATAAALIAAQGNAQVDITPANQLAGKPLLTDEAINFYRQFPVRGSWTQNAWYCCGSSSIAFASNPAAGATSGTLVANSLQPGTYNVFFRPTTLPTGAPQSATLSADVRSIIISSVGQTAVSWTGGLNFAASAIFLPLASTNRNTGGNTHCQKGWSGSGFNFEGYPLDLLLVLAVATGNGAYLHLPVLDDGTAYQSILQDIKAAIPAGVKVYLEIANELWNQTGTANVVWYALAWQSNPAATSANDAAGKYLAQRWHEVATYGKTLFGARWNVDICPVLAWQEGTSVVQATALAYYASQGWTPASDLYAPSVAIYLNASPAIQPTDSVATILTNLQAGVAGQPLTNRMEHLLAESLWYGLPGGVVNYEWGWDSNQLWQKNNTYLNLGAAVLDPGMSSVYQSLGQATLDCGSSVFFVFESGCSKDQTAASPLDEWDNNFDRIVGNASPTPPKLTGVQALTNGAYVPQRNVLLNSGDWIDARNYLDSTTANPYPTFVVQSGSSPINPYNHGWHIYAPTAVTLSIQAYFTSTAARTINAYVDGAQVAASVAIPSGLVWTGTPSGGSAPIPLFTKTFSAGHHYIELGNSAAIPSITVNALMAFAVQPQQAAPVLLYTDIVSGSATNGEGGAGSYLSLFGLNFGATANLGTSLGAKVYIGGAEVANYRSLGNSVVAGIKPGFPNIQRLICQIGSAAVQALTPGVAYPISVVVNGVASNVTDVLGNPLQFTIQPGHFWFVDTVAGNDATGVKDDITHPFRYIQNFGGGTSGATTGIWLTGNLAAGDTIVIRGNGGTPITDQVGYEGRLCRWSNRNLTGGTAPTGAIGHGYVHFTAYPGPINGNACEDVYIFNPAGGSGGFMGAGTAYTRPNGTAGQYWSCSNMRGDTATNPGQNDASNWNLQNSADHTRFVNLDIQWNSTSTGSAHQKAGGWVGNGDPSCLLGSYVHNISGGDPSSLENHGIYMDGSNTCAHNIEVGFCIVDNCTTGQCIQFHNQQTPSDGRGFYNILVHHSWTENSAKYNLKLDFADANVRFWNLVANRSVREGFEFDSTGSSNPSVYVENVTFIDNYHDTAGYTAVVANEGGNLSSGFVRFNNCLFVQLAGRTNTSVSWFGGQSGITASGNVYYDYAGVLTTKYSGDSAGIYVNPQLVNPVVYPNTDAQLQSTSGALNRAATATINPTNDLGMNPQPRAGKSLSSCGAFA